MRTLTAEERAYDFAMTTGRFYNELYVLEQGITVGILSDYLNGNLEADYTPGLSMQSLYEDGIAEGRASQRFEYTAEELFVWAWEFDREAGGDIYPMVKREPLTVLERLAAAVTE